MLAKYSYVPVLASLILLFVTVITNTDSATISDHGKLKISEVSQKRRDPTPESSSLLQIDLNSCTCLNQTEKCEIVILKSTILEIACPPHKLFCCQETKSISATMDGNNTRSIIEPSPGLVPSPANDDPNVKIRLLLTDVPDIGDYSQEETETTVGDHEGKTRGFPSTKFNNLSTPTKLKKQCVCKSRESCPEKYIDYGFGFHCTYDKVHCCGMESEFPTNLTESGRGLVDNNIVPKFPNPNIINVTTTNMTVDQDESSININSNKTADDILNANEYYEEEEEESNIKCYCLPKDNCKDQEDMDDNVVWRRQDTLCPGETIQCCGTELSIISDKLDEVENNQRTNGKDDDPSSSDTPFSLGQAAFRQPVQLSELKIPTAVDYSEQTDEQKNTVTSTLSPPELPTYYNYQPPKYYSGYYYPNHQIPQTFNFPSTTPKYNDGYVRYPWSREPSHYSQSLPGGHRGSSQPFPIEENPRSSPNTSLLDKIANILG